jgi:hypothetical protein
MMRDGLLCGALAGAAGTTALNAITYLDMAARGRPSSELPEQVVDAMAQRRGISLGEDESASNRRQALAALFGFGVGIGIGMAYGAARTRLRINGLPSAIGLAIAASAASDGPAAAMGLTDPRAWGVQGWLSDLVPHLGYGIMTAVTFECLSGSC